MPQRVVTPVRYQPVGGQDYDSDPLERSHGNYRKGKNIHFLTRKGSSTFSVIPSAGNTQVFTLPTVVAQNVIFRIYLDCTEAIPTQRTLQIFDANDILIGSANYTPISGSLGGTYTSAVAAISSTLTFNAQTFIIGALQTTTANASGYFSLEITTISYWEYSLELTTFGVEPLPIVTQEAIDNSLAGKLKFIGSYDLNEDLWIQSTTQRNLPSTLPIVSITNNSGRVSITIPNHGQSTGNKVIVNDVTGITGLPNGIWIITVLNANTFVLNGSVWVNPYLGGTVTINPSGIGEIGVATKNENDSTWNYITLGRTKEWNWVTKKQPKTYAERSNLNASYYWTDNYNYPRKFYYQGAYMTNGVLNYINPLNTYAYGEIELATRLITGIPNLHLTFTNQLPTGGGVYAGNHRYCIRLLDANFNATLYTDPTNEIPVYTASPTPSPSAPSNMGGDAAYTGTGKINQFIISGIIPNLFKYVELVDIYYADGAIVGTTVRRDLLTQQATQVIEHTGTELNTTALDVSSLSAITADIDTALNIDGIRNHLVLSNTTSNVAIDFSPFGLTFQHRIIRLENTVKTVGNPANGTFQLGEYADPMNVYLYTGYMHNEIMRFGFKLRLKTGYVTDAFWIDDISIDTLSTNLIANPKQDRRLKVSSTGCNLGGLPDYDLTDVGCNYVYPVYVEFSQFRLDFVINGVQIRDLVDEIIIERVDISNDEALRNVLTTGVIVKAISPVINNPTNAPYPVDIFIWNGNTLTYNFNPLDLTPYCVGGFGNIAYPTDKLYLFEYFDINGQGAVYNNPGGNYLQQPAWAAFYSADNLFGEMGIQFLPADAVINMGSPAIFYHQLQGNPISGTASDTCIFSSTYVEFNGATGQTTLTGLSVPIKTVWDIGTGGNANDGSIATFYKDLYLNRMNNDATVDYTYLTQNIGSLVLKADGTIFTDTNKLGNSDISVHYIQYIRPRNGTLDNGKYGARTSSNYIPTGASYIITKQSPTVIPISTLNVFGGDVFVQKTYLKNRGATTGPIHEGVPVTHVGFGGGFGYYAQNRVNTQLHTLAPTNWEYPNLTPVVWLQDESLLAPPQYNTSYTIQQDVTTDNAFDPNLPRPSAQPTRIWYSLEKPQDAIADSYTSFLALNYTDIDASFGAIEHHKNINSDLVTWQWLKVEQQFFETTGLMSVNSTDVVLGNAGIMTRVGKTLSTYGTKHGFSVCVGKTAGGKDVVTWLDVIHGKYLRHAMEDGTVVLSDMHTMRSFFNNYFQFASLYNTPADGLGVCSGYDHQNSEFITTVRAYKQVPYFNPASPYTVGSEVQLTVQPPGTYSTFEQTVEIYVCILQILVPNPNTYPETGADWQTYWKKIPHWDINYFNEFTFSFNQEKEKFTTFYSFLPKIYLQRGKSFLTPRPIDSESECYEHLRPDSELCVWYNDGVTEQAEKWYIEGMCINRDANLNKHAMAILMQTDIVPERVDVESKSYQTYMLAADFSTEHDQFKCAIRNDILTADNTSPIPVNAQDTSYIFGSYFNVSLSGSPKVYQKFYNFIMKVRNMTRFYNS